MTRLGEGPVLERSEGSVLEEATLHCLRPPGRVWKVDRSPCGTGTSAAMATLYGKRDEIGHHTFRSGQQLTGGCVCGSDNLFELIKKRIFGRGKSDNGFTADRFDFSPHRIRGNKIRDHSLNRCIIHRKRSNGNTKKTTTYQESNIFCNSSISPVTPKASIKSILAFHGLRSPTKIAPRALRLEPAPSKS